MPKVVLVMNAEVDEVNQIRNKINNRFTDKFIQYCTTDSLVHEKINKNLIENKYSKEIIKAFQNKDYNLCVQLILEPLEIFLEKIFSGVNSITYLKFEANTFTDKDIIDTVVLPVVYSGEKPDFDCVYVGWITPHSPQHLVEHEKFDEETANNFQRAYANMLRGHKEEFDMFFDGNSTEEVMEYIRSL